MTEDDTLQRSIDSLASKFERRDPLVHIYLHRKTEKEPYKAQRRDFTPQRVKNQRVRRSVAKALVAWTISR